MMASAAMPSPWLLLQDGSFSLQSIFLAFFLSSLTVLLLSHHYCSHRKKKARLPPSPWRLPLIGNLHQLSSLPHRPLRDLSQHHGPLMLLRIGQVPTLVVSSAEIAREVMKAQDLVFATRPLSKPADVLSYGSKNVAFAPYGDQWRQAKKAAVVHLLGPKPVQSFRRVREEEVVLLLDEVSRATAASPAAVDLSKAFHSFASSVVCRVVAGGGCSVSKERARGFRELIDEATAVIAGFRLDEVFPSLAWLGKTSGMDSKLWKLFEKWDGFLDHIVEEHEHGAVGEGSEGDFVDVLLSIHREHSMDFPISRDAIKATLMDLVAAGTDTSYVVLEWAMAELVKNPVAMQRAQREAREVTGGKAMATEDDVAQMSYLRAVVKEVLRLHPPAPLLLPRESMADTQLLGYDVPAKTRVLVNAWAIARDPSCWESPEEFRPERFLVSRRDFRGNDFEFIPFGAGRRMCPGINFAVSEIELALANLLHRFDWVLPGGGRVEDFDMAEAPGITIRRKLGLHLVAIPRDRNC